MSEMPHDRPASSPDSQDADEPVRYPTNQVLAVFDDEERLVAAVEALTDGGFLESEVQAECGTAAADRLRDSVGRRGLAGLAIRVADRLGIADPEMESKAAYEQALRDGGCVIGVLVPTAERKERASEILHDHGARLVRFHGKFAIERL